MKGGRVPRWWLRHVTGPSVGGIGRRLRHGPDHVVDRPVGSLTRLRSPEQPSSDARDPSLAL